MILSTVGDMVVWLLLVASSVSGIVKGPLEYFRYGHVDTDVVLMALPVQVFCLGYCILMDLRRRG
ncbi:MAG: hypothetical protein Q8R39_00590 [bacterium]|nr:hypothetical protein [bacterium]MDZ4284534.1 hypothetical protein [Patescibacteria group bacterium]